MSKKVALIALFGMLTFVSHAQFGINLSYSYMFENENWDQWINDANNNNNQQKLIPNNYGLSLDYWFRLKKYRIEFLPEVSYHSGDHDINYNRPFRSGSSAVMNWNKLGVYFNTNIYIFDIEGDCNCPTFGKQDPFFKKGLYLQITPGVEYVTGKITNSSNDENNEYSQLLPSLNLGVGVDIGVSKYWTITPWLKRGLTFNASWNDLSDFIENQESNNNSTHINSLTFGFRVGYRYDYKKRY